MGVVGWVGGLPPRNRSSIRCRVIGLSVSARNSFGAKDPESERQPRPEIQTRASALLSERDCQQQPANRMVVPVHRMVVRPICMIRMGGAVRFREHMVWPLARVGRILMGWHCFLRWPMRG